MIYFRCDVMKKFIIILILLCLGILSFFLYDNLSKINFEIINNNIDVNHEYKITELVRVIKGNLKNKDDIIIFNELGKKEITILLENFLKKEIKEEIVINVLDREKPVIEAEDKITVNKGEKIDLLKDVVVIDNYDKDLDVKVNGEYDLKKVGTYNLEYVVSDKSNNVTIKPFILTIKEKTNKNKYYIKINKSLNVLMVYGLDSNDEYTDLIKTFVVSGGNDTPLGTFKTDVKYETLSLEGGVYGHYTVRFIKSEGIWFHSVPYFSKPKNGHWDDLEYEEYNKLGSLASLGCIRLSTIDAKWIYDNISKGTFVEIYESDSLPEGVVKPIPIKIDVNSPNRGWDPTDPDPDNPWHN